MTRHYDVAIIGSGFSGSILAWILASQGRSVALIDSEKHPRFAIGESSTPIADLWLKRLGQQYGLVELECLSTYGTWQASLPEVACGRKRGFSYYLHRPNEEFTESDAHEHSLMVAASASDAVADTHWYRREVDHFLFNKAIAAGATDISGHRVEAIDRDQPYGISISEHPPITGDWIIDASGRAAASACLLNVPSLVDRLKTNTRSGFGHYRNVGAWSDLLRDPGLLSGDEPFNTDDAAQHHLLGDHWLWMLRFNNGITSVGWTGPDPSNVADTYPSIRQMLQDAELVDPAKVPALTGRLQRLYDPVIDRRCVMLPATACTIDPLHSTGIAHSLAGIGRIAASVLQEQCPTDYGQVIVDEARLLDRLVHTAYQTMNDFPRFTAACMLYFVGAISCEERILAGDNPTHLWGADDQRFVSAVDDCCTVLQQESSTERAAAHVRRAIGPWNTAGLMAPNANNRYAYTATKRLTSASQPGSKKKGKEYRPTAARLRTRWGVER